MFVRRTHSIRGEKSIAELRTLTINGIQQTILIRGANRENPLLLFLHGGPGSAQICLARRYLADLEQDFVVVNWDQRGSGLSYSAEVPKESMTIDQFVDDVRALTECLLTMFGQEKLFLVGHSWGTVIGTIAASRFPHLFHAYVGMGQVVNMEQNEAVSYRYALETAKQRRLSRAVRDLERIGPPPYPSMKELGVQRKWLRRLGGSLRHGNLIRFMLSGLLFNSEYTIRDRVRWLKGAQFSLNHLWGEVLAVNLSVQVPKLAVPVYFILGRYDYQTPSELAVDYLKRLESPRKELIWFEESAHLLVFEEPKRFAETMRRVMHDQMETRRVSASCQ